MKRITIALALFVMVGQAAPAHGDPGLGEAGIRNDAFVAALQAAGIRYEQPDQIVAAGEAVCTLLGSGKSGPEVAGILQKHNSGLTADRAAQFVAIASRSYCSGDSGV